MHRNHTFCFSRGPTTSSHSLRRECDKVVVSAIYRNTERKRYQGRELTREFEKAQKERIKNTKKRVQRRQSKEESASVEKWRSVEIEQRQIRKKTMAFQSILTSTENRIYFQRVKLKYEQACQLRTTELARRSWPSF